LPNRWLILFVLFFARTTMAFQYQSVAALSPLIIDTYAVTLADIGLLIGLYLGPGVVVAILGGSIAARFGDRRVVSAALVLMILGDVTTLLFASWGWLVTGRVLAGIGGVVINVVMTKMLVDWFAGREIGTAMGIFVSSWPAGIALALLILPSLALFGGIALAWIGTALMATFALILFAAIYRTPHQAALPPGAANRGRLPSRALYLAAGIWALYNTALAMVFAFGPILLNERGLNVAAASWIISLFIVFAGLAIPIGGYIADRTGRRDLVILTSLAGSALLLPALLYTPLSAGLVTFSMVGLIFGLAAGPIMTLPSQILRPEVRALGMGIFFTVYYGLMMVMPALVGGLADRAGHAEIAFLFGSSMLIVCVALLGQFRRAAVAVTIRA
jgi:MFS family permease